MKIENIFSDTHTKLFRVTNKEEEDIEKWMIEPTNLELIPDDEEFYIVAAKQIYPDRETDCFINIITPERIADYVIKPDKNNRIIIEDYYKKTNSVIPAVASECFGFYELYYAKENPQIGIDILKEGLKKAQPAYKYIIADELGYILHDENRIEEAIEAFLISEQYHSCSYKYTCLELADLYNTLGLTEKEMEYRKKAESTD